MKTNQHLVSSRAPAAPAKTPNFMTIHGPVAPPQTIPGAGAAGLNQSARVPNYQVGPVAAPARSIVAAPRPAARSVTNPPVYRPVSLQNTAGKAPAGIKIPNSPAPYRSPIPTFPLQPKAVTGLSASVTRKSGFPVQVRPTAVQLQASKEIAARFGIQLSAANKNPAARIPQQAPTRASGLQSGALPTQKFLPPIPPIQRRTPFPSGGSSVQRNCGAPGCSDPDCHDERNHGFDRVYSLRGRTVYSATLGDGRTARGTGTTSATRSHVNSASRPAPAEYSISYSGSGERGVSELENVPSISGRWDAGHIIGRQNTGLGHDPAAVFPQNAQQNRGNSLGGESTYSLWRLLENIIHALMGRGEVNQTVTTYSCRRPKYGSDYDPDYDPDDDPDYVPVR